ncbi:hypothetical protein E3A20_13360 [Planctomyces bekefii]|uniref:Uncharacterized protein n=1 Tax=Planctomyces bekefii TaxID=1653850 RepID=A0A5C6M5Z3_9PLAN|nr:hypothetical protein E3A20_13360 [Planctomyces bekefii]
MKHNQPLTMTDIGVLIVCMTALVVVLLLAAYVEQKYKGHHNQNDSKYTTRK